MAEAVIYSCGGIYVADVVYVCVTGNDACNNIPVFRLCTFLLNKLIRRLNE